MTALAKQAATEITIVPEFDFNIVAQEHRAALEADTEALHRLDTNEVLIRIAKGKLLAKWRDVLDNGLWMQWTATQFRYSHQTALNYISLFENFGDVDKSILDNIAGHYLLAGASEDRRELVIDLAEQGIKVSKTISYIFANAPAYILKLYQEEKLSPSQAQDLIKSYKKIPPNIFEQVESLCYQWRPQHPAGIELLVWSVNNHLAKPSGKTLLSELKRADGALQAAEFSAHISTADRATIEAFQSERNRMLASAAIKSAYTTHRTSAKFNSLKNGTLTLDIPNGLELAIANGASIEIEIKVRK